MTDYGALSTFDNFVHHTQIIFVSLLAHFSRLSESFVQKSSDASRVLCISFLDFSYINFLLGISRYMQSL